MITNTKNTITNTTNNFTIDYTGIIDLINKYKNDNKNDKNCIDIINNINDNIQNIIIQLKALLAYLSDKLYQLNTSINYDNNDDNNDNCIKILNDINTVKQQITQLIKLNESINKPIINDIKPDNNITNNTKNSAFDPDSNTNKYDINNKYELNFNGIIVLSTVLKCTVNKHDLIDITAKIPIFNSAGDINFISINVSYCKQCKRYIMLKNDFKQIDDIIACRVIDQTTNYQNNNKNDEIEIKQKESILYQYGYNVQTQKNLTSKQRHLILAAVVESKIMTREQVCAHLDMLINRGSKIPKWEMATQKWMQDRYYVKKYNNKNLPQILFDRVILKYNQITLDI